MKSIRSIATAHVQAHPKGTRRQRRAWKKVVRNAMKSFRRRILRDLRLAKEMQPEAGSEHASEERPQPEDHLPEHRD